MDEIYVLIAVIIVLIIFFVVRHVRRKRCKRRSVAPNRMNDGVTATEGEEEDSKEEPGLMEMGECTVYPLCPKCDKEMKNMLSLINVESEDFSPEYAQ